MYRIRGISRLFRPRMIVYSVLAASTAIFVTDNLVSLQMISGRSMQPALNPDRNRLWRDTVLMDKFVGGELGLHRLRRGDIITFISPHNPDLLLVKRIIAMPHDCVIPLNRSQSFVRIPQGHCWVEGDESFHSGDSTSFGPIPLSLVKGRVLLSLWPPPRFGTRQLMAGVPDWKRRRVYVDGKACLYELQR